jgi:GR25 family glycosyltransferase involved in LPS biosynthesis
MKAFVIRLSNIESSRTSAQGVATQLKEYGHDVEFFEGIPGDQAVKRLEREQRRCWPYSIKSSKLTDTDLERYIVPELWQEFQADHFYKIYQRNPVGSDAIKYARPGVLGCFYSHLDLWQKCRDLDEPIMIFEDDVKFYRNWQPVDWRDVLILSLGKTAFLEEPWKTYLENPTGTPQPMPYTNYSMPGTSGYAIKPKVAQKLIKTYRGHYIASDNAINASVCEIEIHNHLMGRNTTEDEGNVSLVSTKVWR